MCLFQKVINGLLCPKGNRSPFTLQNRRKLADSSPSVPKVARKSCLPGKVCANAAFTSNVLKSSRYKSSSPPI